MPRRRNSRKRIECDPVSYSETVASSVESESTNNDGEEYLVEAILDHREDETDGRMKYYLKWDGYPLEEATWEDEGNLNCPLLLRQYKAKVGLVDQRRRKAKKIASRNGTFGSRQYSKPFDSTSISSMEWDTGNDIDDTSNTISFESRNTLFAGNPPRLPNVENPIGTSKNGDHSANLLENSAIPPHSPENGGNPPSIPENGDSLPYSPESGDNPPSLPENGHTSPIVDPNPQSDVSISLPGNVETGWDRGWSVKEVVNVTKRDDGSLWVMIDWNETEESEWVPNYIANEKIPHLVIDFYQEFFIWVPYDMRR